ncbi:endonuclease/exonuclease/phosphatase family protein [Candidatus Liberibacter asiaticus]|uniref:Endonuclease/exonuclease/phosphatase domain-containing protein n=2 Tax=Liberibacter asiaticus TaxID=34021 RepID=C6XGH3_LIBAP|nr:endonuclease/exonuclease/phosphatase family protein [Candidatus Liberibacter asiaticus]ACT57476.1 hypothetical protein CLIBASIA_04520 [Candidatus Liberibacter asiaticus str. psy62]AGH17242.1 hypothetical protein WSI_04360 [Candidatus Liberibacter asiaticus str. gxpsy]ALK07537.1 endonuclease/exonuclease/phosphatase family protein [Candidatus Liberibacter asiaticus]ASK53029.1 hypothetical protein B2I23_04495 [Candidatus Liberibacter asiaticus]AWL14353.1 hypothetical protein DIC79_04520 [Candi
MIRKYVLALVFFLVPCTASVAQKVRLVSWNINTLSEQEGVSLWKNSVKRTTSDYTLLRQYAKNLDADIVFLQEMGSYNAVAKVFPKNTWCIFYSTERLINHSKRDSNNDIHTAIAVRKKNVRVLQQSYPLLGAKDSFSRAGNRRAVELLVEINGKKIWVLDIHLKSFCFLDSLENTYSPSCSLLSQQAQWLKDWITQKKESLVPFVIAGDFNRKINYLGNNDDFWKTIDPNDSLIRFPKEKDSRCNANKNLRNKIPIDYFVMDQNAYKFLIQESFSEILYNEDDIKSRGKRLSDHCPISIDYDF